MYGKLLIALLTEKMQRHAAALSHWDGRWLDQDPPAEPVHESEWLLELIRAALWPELKIARCLDRWNDIARDLAERSRLRMPRIDSLLS